MKKIKKRSKFQKCLKSIPSVQTCLGAFFLEKFFCSLLHGFIENFRKKQKKIQNSENAQNRSQKCPNVFWTCFMAIFPIFFCPAIHAGLFRFSGLENMSSVFRNNTQQTFILHSRHIQYTQSHFRFSGLKIMSSDSRI